MNRRVVKVKQRETVHTPPSIGGDDRAELKQLIGLYEAVAWAGGDPTITLTRVVRDMTGRHARSLLVTLIRAVVKDQTAGLRK